MEESRAVIQATCTALKTDFKGGGHMAGKASPIKNDTQFPYETAHSQINQVSGMPLPTELEVSLPYEVEVILPFHPLHEMILGKSSRMTGQDYLTG